MSSLALEAETHSVPTASDIYYKLGGLEGKLDAHNSALNSSLLSTTKRLDSHGTRLDVIERAAARMQGMLILSTPIVSAAIAVGVAYLKGIFG